ncbi:hypothetical protein RND71_035561 [Anisodus tanguticus]|uniref:S-protein homolog n=1 Tax=Anisodus tanguticus TaxID=243964 RepID=A0AAE1V2A6_9SOLA|nr:hypothetical protein RND71_035561 [Anisodus tanguticus]
MSHPCIIILFMLLFIFPLEQLITACFLSGKYHIHVIDALGSGSSELKIHCASKQDDLGYHTLSNTQEFTWEFCEHFFDRTMYFCHVWWGSKESNWEVFNDPGNCIHQGQVPVGTNTCVWVINPDGFYLGYYQDNGTLWKYKNHGW